METARQNATMPPFPHSLPRNPCGFGDSSPALQGSGVGDRLPMVAQITSLLPLLPLDVLLAIKGFIDARHRSHPGQAPACPRMTLTIKEVALLWYFRQLPHEECRNAAVEAIQDYVSLRDR